MATVGFKGLQKHINQANDAHYIRVFAVCQCNSTMGIGQTPLIRRRRITNYCGFYLYYTSSIRGFYFSRSAVWNSLPNRTNETSLTSKWLVAQAVL